MNLICIAALIAVCGAAKLDRTYLPPASAKSAGGSAGSLQTPFAGNSLNGDSNGLPKGSFTNEFQGVVVDAAAAGTRASGEGETGLGASRISYGSTDSRVGDAAFRGTAAAFRPFPSGQNFGAQRQTSNGQGQNFNRQSGQQNFNAQRQSFNGQRQTYKGQGQNFNGQNQNYNGQSQNFNTQNQNIEGPSDQNLEGQGQNFNGFPGQDSNGQSGLEINGQSQNVKGADGQTTSNQVQSSAQGFNQFNSKPQASAQTFQASTVTSQLARAQAASDRAASTLRFENEVGSESYHYAFETDNGISAEENGVATNGVQAQGGFSYTGDDGKVYTVTYTADEGGYQPKGDHLPTPPPIPDEILKALAKNAQDEASGLVDDGSYDAQKYNAGSDYASDSANVEHNDRQAPSFGRRPADASASGTFINQNNQPFVGGLNEQAGQEDGSSDSQDASSNIGSSATSDRFGQFSQTTRNPSASGAFGTTNNFGQAAQPARTPTTNGYGSKKEYLPPVAGSNQNGRPQRPTANTASTFPAFNGMTQATASASFSQSESDKLSSPTLGRPNSNRFEVLAQSSTAENLSGNNEFESSSNVNNFAQSEPSSESLAQTSGSKKEYLPPTFGQNSRPQGLRPQRPTQVADVSVAPSFNTISQTLGNYESNEDSQQFSAQTTFATGTNSQAVQQYNTFQQRPQSFNNQISQNRFPSIQRGQDENKDISDKSEESSNGQVSSGFSSFNQGPTSQPSTELTTPFESNEQEQGSAASSSASFNGFTSQSNTRPGFSKGNQSTGQSTRRPVNSSPSQTSASAESQSTDQFDHPSISGGQPTEQNADVQFSPSTTRPSFGQPQGLDQSYYYRQPPKPFNTPSGSRFPVAPPDQFNRVNQQSAQSISQFPGAARPNFAQNTFQTQNQFNRGSTRYPELPTLAPTSLTGSNKYPERTFSSQNNGITQASISPFQVQNQGSTKYPRPPSLPPAPTTLASQSNGITQATASSFTSASSAPFATFEQTASNQAKPSAQSSGSLAQQSEYNQNEITQGESHEIPQGESQNIPTQQYNGEIYEYSKPPQGLPSPAQKEPVAPPQRGQNFAAQRPSARPQFGSSQTNNGQEINAQKPTRPSFVARPQFSAQSTRPQFGFNPQGSTSFAAQSQPSQDSQPQAQQFAQSQDSQGSTSFGSQGRPNKCCQSLDAKLDSIRKNSQNNAATTQNQSGLQAISQSGNAGGFVGQFDNQFSGPTSQPQSQAFAGRGESFGGPRKPPSFDQQTGYHY